MSETLTLPQGVCRICGCTEAQACVDDAGPCAWADRDQTLCTACAGQDGELAQWFQQFIDRYVEDSNGPDSEALIACLDRVRDSYRQAEEITFWRENAAAQMDTLYIHLQAAPDAPLPDFLADPWRRLRELHGTLDDALTGRTALETCECCGKPVRVGDPVISSNVGDLHATCMDATPEQIAAGSMPCKVEDIDFENIDDDRAETLRADPRLAITIHGPLYTPEAMRATHIRTGQLLADRAAAEDEADSADEGVG